MKHGEPHVLVISNVPPLVDIGGGIRTIEILELFKSIGYETSVYLLYPKEWGQLNDKWLSITNEKYGLSGVSYYPLNERYSIDYEFYRKLKSIQDNFDLLVFRFEQTAFKGGFYLLKTPVVIDYDDFSYPLAKGLKEKVRTTAQLVLSKLLNTRAIVVQREHLKYWGNNKAIWIPNLSINAIFIKTDITKKRAEKPTLLSVGFQTKDLLNYIQNEWLKLKQSIPDLELYVISRNATAGFESMEGIYYLNNVEDLVPYYERAWALLLVSKQKYGTHIKILESVLYKTPVVALNNSLRGYEDINSSEELILTALDHVKLSKLLIETINDRERLIFLSEKGYFEAKKLYSLPSLSTRLKNWIISSFCFLFI
jgi:glycosyltransferase involved in cell wall biosynthesis